MSKKSGFPNREIKKIEVRCPICSVIGYLDTQNLETRTDEDKGLYSTIIREDVICEHHFLVYIDNNGATRSSVVSDIEVHTRNREESTNWIAQRLKKKE